MKIIEMYQCEMCGKNYSLEEEALNCEKIHYEHMKNNATIFFNDGEEINLADFMQGERLDIGGLIAIKVTDEKTAQFLQNYLYHEWGITFPYLSNSTVSQWPITMICEEESWVWTELNTAIEEEEERHTARMKELENYR